MRAERRFFFRAVRQALFVMAEPFLELLGITKSYPGVVALNEVSLSVRPGEVIGLIGRASCRERV